jgi:hypothetical protein
MTKSRRSLIPADSPHTSAGSSRHEEIRLLKRDSRRSPEQSGREGRTMSENIKQQSNTGGLAAFSTKQVVAWSAGISGMVVLLICLGVLGQRAFYREFLGDRTRLIHLCKKNPNSNPAACADLIAARTGTIVRKPRALPGTFERPTFSLSNDKDADLKPPPDLVR